MKKVAFFLDNKAIADVDVTVPEKGNPGIGGTEYLFILVSSMLAKRDNGIQIKLWLTHKQSLPTFVPTSVVNDLPEAIQQAEAEGYDSFVLKHDVGVIQHNYLSAEHQIDFIVWCHVYACYWELDYYANAPAVKKIVYVGREMYDLYRDHPSFKKATYIYNCVNLEGCKEAVAKHPFSKRQHVVTYIGSLVPFKGFHKLAEVWPWVLKEVSDAQLYVIGSGKVYHSSAVLGEYGVAESIYESFFMKYLLTEDGHVMPSVHFMGRMGTEKNHILLKTKVGVPNPTGITETFCLSAVEMQSYGATVVTMKAPGYLDTIKNGVLCSNTKELAETIVRLLRTDESSSYETAMAYFEKEFSVESALAEWERLLQDKNQDSRKLQLVNPGYRLKWLKEGIRLISAVLPMNRILPSVERVLILIERKIFRNTTYIDSEVSL